MQQLRRPEGAEAEEERRKELLRQREREVAQAQAKVEAAAQERALKVQEQKKKQQQQQKQKRLSHQEALQKKSSIMLDCGLAKVRLRPGEDAEKTVQRLAVRVRVLASVYCLCVLCHLSILAFLRM